MGGVSDDLGLAVKLSLGDVPAARDILRAGRVSRDSSAALRHAIAGDRPGVARMLVSEGVIDVASVVCDDLLVRTCHVAAELLSCGMDPPAGMLRTPLEVALSKALVDCRSTAAAAGMMMRMSERNPDVYRRLLAVADMGASGPELLHQVLMLVQAGADAPETGDTPATP